MRSGSSSSRYLASSSCAVFKGPPSNRTLSKGRGRAFTILSLEICAALGVWARAIVEKQRQSVREQGRVLVMGTPKRFEYIIQYVTGRHRRQPCRSTRFPRQRRAIPRPSFRGIVRIKKWGIHDATFISEKIRGRHGSRQPGNAASSQHFRGH